MTAAERYQLGRQARAAHVLARQGKQFAAGRQRPQRLGEDVAPFECARGSQDGEAA